MVATREKWEAAPTFPRGASYQHMLEFFGIPPHSTEALGDNIAKIRRGWSHLSDIRLNISFERS
jgi:hypothetical protein